MRSIVIDRDRRLWCGTRALRIYQARISFFVLIFVFVRYPRCANLVGGRAEVDADLPIKNVLFFIFLLVFKKLIVPGGCTEVAADLPR